MGALGVAPVQGLHVGLPRLAWKQNSLKAGDRAQAQGHTAGRVWGSWFPLQSPKFQRAAPSSAPCDGFGLDFRDFSSAQEMGTELQEGLDTLPGMGFLYDPFIPSIILSSLNI